MADPERYARVADAAWRWVLDQVRWDDGPWIPASVSGSESRDESPQEPPGDRDGMHSGVGGLAHVLAEIRLARDWTAEEQELADAIVERVRARTPTETDATFFDGLVSAVGVLVALQDEGAGGAGDAVARLTELAAPDGWSQSFLGPPRFLPGTRILDATLGTAGVLLGAVWAHRSRVPGAAALAERAAAMLLAEAVDLPTGTDWPWVPHRFRTEPGSEMPNWSHGLAGIAAAVALAGAELDRPDLVAAARRGAEHLVTLGDRDGGGFVVPRSHPEGPPDMDQVTYTWCHGATGTSLLFAALDHAGVEDVAGETPSAWHARCLHSVRTSGVPDRLRPGFWDNDGRCCGTAGVGDVFLDAWHRSGRTDDLAFAVRLADALVDRAVLSETGGRALACWRFVEHRAPDPLLPPGVGWMQGTAGIAAYLFRTARVLRQGRAAPVVGRMETWWGQ